MAYRSGHLRLGEAMNTEQSIRFHNLLGMASDCAHIGLLDKAEGYLNQALMLLRIEIKAAEATK
jgi:hypothetical protein